MYDYPKDIKAFYMRMNDDNETVAAMDLLVPRIGELIAAASAKSVSTAFRAHHGTRAEARRLLVVS